MTVSDQASPNPSRFDRVVDWVLDYDGEIYGDERSRLRWYEGLAFTASIQWVLVLWVLAACAWKAPNEAAPYLWSIAIAFVVPMYLSLIYAARRGVDVRRPTRTGKARIIELVTVAPMLIFVIGMSDIHPTASRVIFGALGGCFAVAVVFTFYRRKQAHRAPNTDLD